METTITFTADQMDVLQRALWIAATEYAKDAARWKQQECAPLEQSADELSKECVELNALIFSAKYADKIKK